MSTQWEGARLMVRHGWLWRKEDVGEHLKVLGTWLSKAFVD